MNRQQALRLFSYTRWANRRFVEAIRSLSDEQFTRTIPSSFPTIRDTFAHMVATEWVWLRRWKGESPTAPPEWSLEASLDTLVARLRSVEEKRDEFLAVLQDEDLSTPVSYRSIKGEPFTYPLEDLITHVANHASYHRGQLTTMLRQAGATPPATDYSVWLRESSE